MVSHDIPMSRTWSTSYEKCPLYREALQPGCSPSGPLHVDSLGLTDAPQDHVVEHVVQERVALHGLQR